MLIDTHAHLTDAKFDADLDAVIERAEEAGVGAIVDVGESLASSRRCVAHAHRYRCVFAAVGIHPNSAGRAGECDFDEIGRLADDPRVVAIGETGLDHHREWTPRDRQEMAFRASLRLAAEKGLPVIMHCRKAYADLIAILEEEREKGLAGVLHCFSGTASDAESLVALGCFISIGGTLTYPGNGALRGTVRRVPLERILVETDSPYLAPQRVRGRRNEPAHLTAVAEELAGVRGMAVEDVAAVTTGNARRLFRRLGASG